MTMSQTGVDIKVKVLSNEEIQSLITLDEVISLTEDVYRRVGEGKVECPTKISVPLPGNDERNMHWINAMPAVLKDDGIVGMKWVNVTSANRHRSLPVTMGTILLNAIDTALPLAVMDGTWITHVRTGASVAVGAKYFSRPDSKTVTIIGAGSEGRSALEALARVRDIRKVRIVDIDRKVAEAYVQSESQKVKADFEIYDNAEKGVVGTDMIILTTTARKPIVKFDWARKGQFICTVSCMTDLDMAFIEGSDKFVVDSSHCALSRISAMAGLEVGEDKIYADMCQIAAGEFCKRENDREIITYAPAGMGAVDVAVAYLAYTKAKNIGIQASLYKEPGAR
jgi:ornithine cyclodeaminase/alanine dehydrogenase-like protein (mu-crystallin family)